MKCHMEHRVRKISHAEMNNKLIKDIKLNRAPEDGIIPDLITYGREN